MSVRFTVLIALRQSCRSFGHRPVTEEQLARVLEAANAAPVGMGHYDDLALTVVQDATLLAKLEEHAFAQQEWMGPHPLYGAGTVVCISHQADNEAMGWANVSCVAENMLLAATDEGLGSIYLMAVPMAARSSAELCEALHVPDGFLPFAMVGIGTPSAPQEGRALTTDRIACTRVR